MRQLEVRPERPEAGQNLRTRPETAGARQTNAEVRNVYTRYMNETRRRITPQTGFSAALLGVRPEGPEAGQNLRTRPETAGARQTNAEVRNVYTRYMNETRRRITPQTGFSAALLGGEI